MMSRCDNITISVTGITPAMTMRLTGIGSTYLWTMVDANKEPFDGAKTFKVTTAEGHPTSCMTTMRSAMVIASI